jgi:hypothetical protein
MLICKRDRKVTKRRWEASGTFRSLICQKRQNVKPHRKFLSSHMFPAHALRLEQPKITLTGEGDQDIRDGAAWPRFRHYRGNAGPVRPE